MTPSSSSDPEAVVDPTAASVTVLAGPTAVGKGTVSRRLIERHPEVMLSISATTRPPRPGEIEAVHYFFTSEDEFTSLIETGHMLEWATVHGRYRYGTPRQPVMDAVARGTKVLLEIDLAGARQVRKSLPSALFVFLAPPNWGTLVERLEKRGTETAAERERRLRTARTELAAEDEFDVTIVNDQLDRAVDELAQVMGISASSNRSV